MKYIVITGASKGIGKAIALSFLQEKNNFSFALTYNTDYQGAYDTAFRLSESGFFVILVKMDVSNPEEVKKGFDYIYQCFPRVDVLINNAGISLIKPFASTSFEEWSKIISVNLHGAFHTTKQVVDKMTDEGGVILNVSSIWGEIGASCEVAYSASKAGLIGFSKALAKEYPLSIKALSVGFVDTKMNSSLTKEEIDAFLAENPEVSLKTPEEIGKEILQIVISELNKVEKKVYLQENDEPVVLKLW